MAVRSLADLQLTDDFGRQVVLQPAAYLLLERELFLAEREIHWGLLVGARN